MVPAKTTLRKSPAAAFRPALTRTAAMACIVAVLASFAPGLPGGVPGGQMPGLPDPGRMEQDLLAVLNRERASRGLPSLRPSASLAGLARAHSAEMARTNVLSHASTAGKDFTGRLVDAGVLFAANGENVAQSWSAAVEAIHKSFMDSPGHRANILNRDFDEVGIGIVRGRANVYFVTEDFLGSLAQRPDGKVRQAILGVLDRVRAAAGRPRVVLVDEADRTAAAFAASKAAGLKDPPVPSYFGDALLRFIVGPDLNMIADTLEGADLAPYGRAGIGVAFVRNGEYRGGAYVVCVLLLKDPETPWPDELDRLRTVLAAANEFRARRGLPRLELDPALSERADAVLARHRPDTAATARQDPGRDVFYAIFQRLDRFDTTLRKRLEDPTLRRIGIATVPMTTRDGTLLNYAVAVVVSR